MLVGRTIFLRTEARRDVKKGNPALDAYFRRTFFRFSEYLLKMHLSIAISLKMRPEFNTRLVAII